MSFLDSPKHKSPDEIPDGAVVGHRFDNALFPILRTFAARMRRGSRDRGVQKPRRFGIGQRVMATCKACPQWIGKQGRIVSYRGYNWESFEMTHQWYVRFDNGVTRWCSEHGMRAV
jgi:hypothetical protein